MPLTAKGSEIKANMERQYGAEKGEKVFYASKNAGTISGVDSARRMDASVGALLDSVRHDARTVKSLSDDEILELARRRVAEKEKQGRMASLSQEVAALKREQKAKGDAAKMDASVGAMCDACGIGDDRRVVGGVGARFDASKKGEHELTVEFDGDFDMGGLMRALQYLGAIGASRTLDIAVDDRDIQGDLKKEGIPSKLGWDGDGADKIRSCTIDGKSVLK